MFSPSRLGLPTYGQNERGSVTPGLFPSQNWVDCDSKTHPITRFQNRLRDHAKSFDDLLSLIPAKTYFGTGEDANVCCFQRPACVLARLPDSPSPTLFATNIFTAGRHYRARPYISRLTQMEATGSMEKEETDQGREEGG